MSVFWSIERMAPRWGNSGPCLPAPQFGGDPGDWCLWTCGILLYLYYTSAGYQTNLIKCHLIAGTPSTVSLAGKLTGTALECVSHKKEEKNGGRGVQEEKWRAPEMLALVIATSMEEHGRGQWGKLTERALCTDNNGVVLQLWQC